MNVKKILLCLSIVCALILCLKGVQAADELSSHTVIGHAQLSTHIIPPTPVVLPHRMQTGQYMPDGELISYHLKLNLVGLPQNPLGIYVPKLSLSGSVFLNGEWVANCSNERLSHSRCLHRPHLFIPPLRMWKKGANDLTFKLLVNNQQMNGLSRVWVGDAVALHTEQLDPALRLRVTFIQALMWISIGIGLVSLGVSMVLKDRPMFFWFSLCSLVYAASCINELWVDSQLPPELLSWFIFSSRIVSVPLLFLTLLSVMPHALPRVRYFLIAVIVISPIVLALSENMRQSVIFLYTPLMAVSAYIGGYLLWHARMRRSAINAFAGVLTLCFLCVGVIDWLRLSGSSNFEGVLFGTYAFGVMLLLVGSAMAITLAEALRTSIEFNTRLETEVANRAQQIETLNRELMKIEIQRSRMDEREKLLHDMHDGFGSQLASAKIMLQNQKLSRQDIDALIDDCMADLHLVVDNLMPSCGSLNDAFNDLNNRLLRRFAHFPIKISFDVQLSDDVDMDSHRNLQCLRIVQEAIANAVKHSNATKIRVTATIQTQGKSVNLLVSIQDNGKGIPKEVHSGRGINSMLTRAREMDATLTFSQGPGLKVELTVGLQLALC
jgi:signal transduction histidine kinase